MSGPDRFARMLRWYPRAWRRRYGEEMVALLEDTHGMARVSWSDRLSIVKAGSLERLRSPGFVGDGLGPDERVRAGSLLVLCAWGMFAVAGAIFAKFTDNWEPVARPGDRILSSGSYTAVRVGAMLGGVIVLLAGFVVLPAVVRLIRWEGRTFFVGLIRWTVWLVAAVVGLTVGFVVWAHHLSYHDRNGGLWSYQVAFVVWSGFVVASIGVCTAAGVSLTRRLILSTRELRTLGVLAIVLSATMAVIIAGTLTWWAAVASAAPGFLGNGLLATSNVLAPPLLLAGILMLVGLALAVAGSLRVGQALGGADR
jgi:hypothetical protein